MRLKYKLMFLILSGTLAVAAAALLAFRYLVSNYNQLMYEKSAALLSVTSRGISSDILACVNISTQLVSDRTLQQNIETATKSPDPLARRDAALMLNNLLITYNSYNKYISCIKLVYGDTVLVAGQRSPSESEERAAQVTAAAKEEQGAPVIMSTQEENSVLVCARVIRKFENFDLSELGLLYVCINLPDIVHDNLPDSARTAPMNVYLTQNDEIIYPWTESPENLYPNLSASQTYAITPFEGETQFVVQRSVYGTPFTCILGTPYNRIFRTMLQANAVFLAAVILVSIITICISNLLVGNLVRHFDALVMKLQRYKGLSSENMPPAYDYSGRHDEIGVLHNEFDNMAQRINELIEDNYVKQLLVKDAQIKALEQQINPHFLYNTLNLINWEAQALDAPNIPRVVEALRDLLRGTLSEKSETIPLSKELSIAEAYLRIQQIRFGDRLNCDIQADPQLMDVLVPKMSVQPLIENAIKYALEPNTEPCHIYLRTHLREDRFTITVSNTGSQIDEQILSKLASHRTAAEGFGIGLENIDARIKLIFGQEFGLSFYNTSNTANVEILLPYPGRPV